MTAMYNCKTLKLARESRGLSQSKLADMLKITQATLSRFEKGQLPISDSVIAEASKVLNYPLAFFQMSISVNEDTTLFYRKRASMTVKDLSVLESRISILANSIDELADSIEIPELRIPSVEPSPDNTPSEIAFKIRNYLKIPSGPVDNIVSILEKNGVVVVFLELDGMDKFDGITMFTQKQIPVIWLNKNMPNDRKRFSLSHELGHLVMHLRSEDFDKAEETKEQEANEFASEFLMPESQCKLDLFGLKYKDLGLRKQYWKVSKAALIHRAQELNCIPAQTAQYLYITLGRNGERKNESVNVSIDEPQILKKMTDLHVTELKYTMEELSDIVGLGIQEIRSSLMGENKTISLRPAKISLSF